MMQPDLPEQAPPAPAQPMQPAQAQPAPQPAPQMSPYMNAGYAPGGGGFSFNKFFIIGLSLAMVSVLLLSIPDMVGGEPVTADQGTKYDDAEEYNEAVSGHNTLSNIMGGIGGLLMGAAVLCITMALIKEGFDSDVTHVALRCVLVASGAWLLSSYVPIILGAVIT